MLDDTPVSTHNTTASTPAAAGRTPDLRTFRKRVALHKRLKLWDYADLGPQPSNKADVYWHGTLVANIDSILQHGLVPGFSQDTIKATWISTQAHASLFWARCHLIFELPPPEVALIRIPGTMLDESLLEHDPNSRTYGYGHEMPERVKASRRSWTRSHWGDFQSIYGAVLTTQIIPVTRDMIVRVPIEPWMTKTDTVYKEFCTGVPGTAFPQAADSSTPVASSAAPARRRTTQAAPELVAA